MNSPDSLERVQRLITDQLSLPSPPAIAVQILNAVQREDVSLHDLARIISADPALTAKLLRVANSSFYALPHQITSIERALTVLGMNVIKNIALSFAIAGNLRGDEQTGFDFNYFWRRSVTSAIAAELLTTLLEQKNEDIFVTALLHDIGVLVIYLCKGEEYSNLFSERVTSGIPLVQLERQKFGFDHQLVGATLISAWGLPASISEPMRYHHERGDVPEEYKKTAEILSIAGRLSAIYNEKDSARQVRLLQKELTVMYNLQAEQVRELVDNVANETIEILKTFEIDPGDIRPFSQMLQEANEQLGQMNLSYEQLVLELKEAKEKAERLAGDLREANSRLKELVFRDGLTGLYNHRYFQEILEKEVFRSQRYHSSLSLVMFDIDFFKKVNDTYGHPVGDLVLINIARTAAGAVRSNDVVSRYGGEEFAVILPETDQSGLRVFAERLRRSIEKMTTEAEGKKIKVTISVGGVTSVPEMTDITKKLLVDTADKALYASKENGRNRVTLLDPFLHIVD
jgi:diguanylate cyclase (GGDEF)-like protein